MQRSSGISGWSMGSEDAPVCPPFAHVDDGVRKPRDVLLIHSNRLGP